MKTKLQTIIILTVCICSSIFAQPPQNHYTSAYQKARWLEAGLPVIRNYEPQEYDGDTQNWSIVQDNRGIMYFGNNEGVLEFDGVSWRKIAMPNASAVRSLAVDGEGRIYVGAEEEFGYLTPDSIGELRYISLIDRLPSADIQIAEVRKTLVNSGGIYFQTPDHLFRWSKPDSPPIPIEQTTATEQDKPSKERLPAHFDAWEPQTSFYLAFVVYDNFYVRQKGIGLTQMIGDSLQLVPGGEIFDNQAIHVMLPFAQDSSATPGAVTTAGNPRDAGEAATDQPILIGTLRNGLYLYNGVSIQPFATEIDEFLYANQLYHGAVLGEGIIALGTLRGGVALINQKGELLQIINKASGLQDEFVLFLSSDNQGGLWLALNNGLARIDSPGTYSFYGEALGIGSDVYGIARHSGQLYAATGLGVVYLEAGDEAGQPPAFRALPGIDVQSWSLLSFGKSLLTATSTGVYEIKEKKARNIIKDAVAYALYRSKVDSNRVYVGFQDGLGLLERRKGEWQYAGRYPDISENIRTIAEDEKGALWLGTLNQGVLFIENSNLPVQPEESEMKIIRYHDEHGLPAGWTGVYAIDERIVFATFQGLRRFDAGRNYFVPDSAFGSVLADTTHRLEYLTVDRQGKVWTQFFASGKSEIGAAIPQNDGTYGWYSAPFSRIGGFTKSVYAFFIEEDPGKEGIVWFGGTGGMVRYNPAGPGNYTRPFSALVRRVAAKNDFLIFGGAMLIDRTGRGEGLPANNSVQQQTIHQKSFAPTIGYTNNALRFAYAAPGFDDPAGNRFQYFLEGFDDAWSGWTREVQKEYTNLPAGAYRFRVRAKNTYEQIGEEGVFAFAILRPWYQTWWAYLIYGVFFTAFIALVAVGFNKWRTRQLEQKNRELEQMVKARTMEISQQSEVLRVQKEEIAKQKDQIQHAYENVELLSRIGRAITGTLSIGTIIDTVYENVNALMDATLFGIGIYNEGKERIDFPATKEKEKTLDPYFDSLSDESRPAVWCFKNQQEIMINDFQKEYRKYVKLSQPPVAGKDYASLLYVPLINQDRAIGVITAQSFRQNAYTEYHLNILRHMATYAAIALDNAHAYRKLKEILEHLKATQDQLVIQEKLASLGQLTAGIAHEIKNPLNFVNNFAQLSIGLTEELTEFFEKEKDKFDSQTIEDIEESLTFLKENVEKINEHGKRADSIVRNMLLLSRGKPGEREKIDLNGLLDEYVALAYHGMRAKNSFFNVTINKDYDKSIGLVEMVPQDLSRVFLNILTNALYAAQEKKEEKNDEFSPTLTVTTKNLGDQVKVCIRDNGKGIPQEHLDKIFNPFFTTKPSGEGTGLGLSISYDIIMQHKGELKVETEEGKYTEFIIRLPKS